MNLLELVPVAIEAGQDALALTKAVKDHSKEETVAAVEQSLPLLAKVSGQPLEVLQQFLTPAAVGDAYDLVETGLKIGALVEEALKKRAAAAA